MAAFTSLFPSRRRQRPTSRARRPLPAHGLAGRDFLLLLLATLGTFANYAPMLTVVPLWTARGAAGEGGAGAATAVTMATTVGVQLCMGRLTRRFTLRGLLCAGALLLGLPTFGYVLSSGLAWVLTVSAVRGVGFGVVAVTGSALVAELVPSEQRGRAVGWYGVAVGLPQVVFLPLGAWFAAGGNFGGVFGAAGALSVLAVPLVMAMSGRRPAAGTDGTAPAGDAGPDEQAAAARDAGPGEQAAADGADGTAAADGAAAPAPSGRYGPLLRPALLLAAASVALGGLTSFLPFVLVRPDLAPTALFVLFVAMIAGRWAAGVWSDRRGPGRLVLPAAAVCAPAVAVLALTAAHEETVPVALAMVALYGLADGALQNETLVLMFRRAGPSGSGAAGTAWNMAYDGGTGLGSAGVGLAAPWLGAGGAFGAVAALIALSVPAGAPLRPGGRVRRACQGGTPGGAPPRSHP
ncbi:MFS transporter [Streptomyces sp. CB02923]|uniref:MFS transporter n=1 Tax=Streptomyces sp. CB02923 TaxID=1718985 RepID=UPI00093D3620|nr:MFS transporter [Streptomyces sp. CB02923]